jgi:hypothetical protein
MQVEFSCNQNFKKDVFYNMLKVITPFSNSPNTKKGTANFKF